jgi:Na+(H+)/acetate symporter ActP
LSTPALVALVAIALVGIASAVIGSIGVRVARSTSDFLVASRTVGTVANAGAISGEYLSAASFLGIAGLILREGADALWYPIAFVAGYLALVLFVAAPLRRSGASTVPDFAEVRLSAPALRRVCTTFVLVIGWLYLLPQLQGAGLALTTLTTLPGIAGVLVGGGLSGVAVCLTLFATVPSGWMGVLLHRPAAISVPAAFLTVVVVSMMTRAEIPPGVDGALLRLHAPERLGLSHDRLDHEA